MHRAVLILAAAITLPSFPTSQPHAVGCGAGGGFRFAPNADVIYSYSVDADTVTVQMLVVARAQPGWRGFDGSPNGIPASPYWSDRERFGGGGTIDTTWIVYDRRENGVYLGSRTIPFEGRDNVLLLDRIDGVGGGPVASGTA